jgi:beta-phosphoglucomutase-like phosphatase (HAD superfamily)
VTADDISRGKPDPEGYLKASTTLGFAPQDCLVFDNAPAGIEAARSAGCGLMIIEGTLTAPVPDAEGWMKDYRRKWAPSKKNIIFTTFRNVLKQDRDQSVINHAPDQGATF